MTHATSIAFRQNGHAGRFPARVLALAAFLFLAACSSDAWFGADEAPPLPGERISILAHETTLTPDPEAVGKKVVLPRPFQNPDWPPSGGYANHAMHHLAVSATLRPVWQADTGVGAGGDRRLITAPVVSGGLMFTFDAEHNISAFRADTGARIWRVNLTPEDEEEDHFGGGIAAEGDRVFVSTGFAEVVALEAKTGARIWRQHVSAPMRSAPTVRGGRVFVVTLANTLHALAASDGRSLWTHQGVEETAVLLGTASPAVDSGVVVAPFSTGEIAALKVENGRVLWTDTLANIHRTDAVSTLSQIRGRPVIDRGMVIAVSHAGRMAALDLVSGRRIWEKPIGGMEAPWVAGNYVFVLTNDQEIVALARDSGNILWVTSLPQFSDPEDRSGPIIWTGPILVSDRLIVAGSDGQAMAISPYTGNILGGEDLPEGASVPPIVANGMVYFLTENAGISAYR